MFDPSLYAPIFWIAVGIMCYAYSFRLLSSPDYRLQEQKNSFIIPFIISIIIILFLGTRPFSGAYFGDTASYGRQYSQLFRIHTPTYEFKGDWLWEILMVVCKLSGLTVYNFFLIVETGYILSVLFAIKKFVPTNPMLGMLFVFSSLMFYTFGVNGLRNGLACHLLLLAFPFWIEKKYIPASIISFIALSFHKTTLMPLGCLFLGMWVIKDFKLALYIWIACIFLSLLAGNLFANFFSQLGVDDRMTSYLNSETEDEFSSTGFRFDFLLYSTPPIILAWYAIIKKKIVDDWYRIMAVTYCLANAFWVLVIRIPFTNRVGYLSWFIYPILFAYPLINLPIWKDQDKQTGIILIAYCSFSLFMQFVVWKI